jgi:hypothetical protein
VCHVTVSFLMWGLTNSIVGVEPAQLGTRTFLVRVGSVGPEWGDSLWSHVVLQEIRGGLWGG